MSWASSSASRKVMKANKARDTGPEMKVRRLAHARGLRYRVDSRPVPSLNRRADMTFARAKAAVFIDGCFWHGCPEHHTRSKSNADFWSAKVEANIARDADTNEKLEALGWTVIRAWEHEPPEPVVDRIEAVVRGLGDATR